MVWSVNASHSGLKNLKPQRVVCLIKPRQGLFLWHMPTRLAPPSGRQSCARSKRARLASDSPPQPDKLTTPVPGQTLLMLLLTAAFPLLAVLILLVLCRLSTVQAMAWSLGLTALLALFSWQMSALTVAAAVLEGLIIAASVLWIMFGAILLLNWQQQTGHLQRIRQAVASLSPDPRLQLLWLGWFGTAFLEGIAGFGTPAAILAPLLLALGFGPVAAVVLPTIADSAPVTFGALGTPLLIGMAQGVPLTDSDALLDVAGRVVWLDLWAAPLLPVMMLALYCRCFNPHQLPFWPALPHALLAGFAYSIAAWGCLHWFGPEFPALLAALSGLAVSVLSARYWPPAGLPAIMPQTAANTETVLPDEAGHPTARLLPALLPYLLLVGLLLLSRLPELPFRSLLQQYQWQFPHLLGSHLSTSLQPLYLPGTFFLLVLLLLLPFTRQRRQLLTGCMRATWPKLRGAMLALGCALPLVRIFVHSDDNHAGLPSMPVYLAELASSHLQQSWLWVSALFGALGSFIAGSSTFSNLLFARLQQQIADSSGLDAHLVLALQQLGANAGNMICLLNLVAAAAVVGLAGRERELLKLTLGPMLIYLSAVTLLAVFAR